jgi:hypothetical protein
MELLNGQKYRWGLVILFPLRRHHSHMGWHRIRPGSRVKT